MTPGVWTWTTFCTNLMAHTRTLEGAESIRFRMLDLIAVIICQAFALEAMAFLEKKSSGLVIL
jgi:hypothetical protein